MTWITPFGPPLGGLVLLVCLTFGVGSPGWAETKLPKDYHEQIRQDLRKNLSPHMWNEVQSLLDRSPAQSVELTPQEKQDWSKLLQLHGGVPAWLEQLRNAPPQDSKIEGHP